MKSRAAAAGVAAMIAVSCSGGNDAVQEPDDVAAVTTTTQPDASFTEVPTTVPDRPTFADGPLVDVCPSNIVIQLDGLPAVEHGPLFALLADAPIVDAERQTVSGALRRPDGSAENITLELRAGGPAIDFRTPLDVLSSDEAITLAEVSVANAAATADTSPTTGVVSLTDRSHQMIMWDPATYPDVTTLDDLSAAGVEIRHVTGERFVDHLAESGILDAADLVDGFFGEPAAFVAAGGSIAQQGNALVEPFLFPSLPQWNKPIAFSLAADSGWADYDDVLVVRAADIDAISECLGRLVPIVQDGIVSYSAAPGGTNQLMASARESFNPLTRAAPELLDQAAQTALETAIISNGPDGVVGSFDIARLRSFAIELGLDDAVVDQVVTNDFIALDRSL